MTLAFWLRFGPVRSKIWGVAGVMGGRVYHWWLDRWDARRVRRGDAVKALADFGLDAQLAFPGAEKVTSIPAFCALADQAMADPGFWDGPINADPGVEREEDWLTFPSDLQTDIAPNNTVWARVTEGGSFNQVLVVFHHWNANAWQHQIAGFFSRRGVTVVEIAMPYHFQRSRPGALHADHMLSPNVGRTIQSVRQAVLDGCKLIGWLKGEGYDEVTVLGLSLGSWVAGLVAAHEPAVNKAALFLTGGSLADMVWTGRATRQIRASLEPEIGLADLRRAWAPLNLETHVRHLARPDLDLQVVLAKRDQVVWPDVSDKLLQALRHAGAAPDVLQLNCGHYSLALPPHILFAGLRLKRLLGV